MTQQSPLAGYKCAKCNWSDVFAVATCPRCHGETTQVTFPPEGEIASFTIVRYPPQGFEKQSPYAVALIDIKDGPRVMARVSGVLEDLQIGKRVTFTGIVNEALEFKA
ncbi:MAG TPA: OB-fold domain-containing protein [Terriglobales bacterium]|nr:OB-fold domain-containing protein [Terriglobales bacterium]